MGKWVVIGGLLGGVIGYVLMLLFPQLLLFEVLYEASSRKQLGIPLYPQYNSGSVLAGGLLFPMLLGIVGGILAILITRRKKEK